MVTAVGSPSDPQTASLAGVATAADGSVWSADVANGRLVHLAGGAVGYVALGADAFGAFTDSNGNTPTVGDVAIGLDRSVYVGERGAIGRVTPAGAVTRIPVPGGDDATPAGLASGSDGNLWFTEDNRPVIGRLDSKTGTIVQFADGSHRAASRITPGPDGNLWYTLPTAQDTPGGSVGRITPDGSTTDFRPHQQRLTDLLGAGLGGIVSSRDRLWILADFEGQQAKGHLQAGIVELTVAGQFSLVPASANANITLAPTSVRPIAAGGDGSLYFASDSAAGNLPGHFPFVGRLLPNGALLKYSHPTGLADNSASAIASGGDSSVWLTSSSASSQAAILEHLLPSAPFPCVVPNVIGEFESHARRALLQAHCAPRFRSPRGPKDTPPIVIRQATAASTVLAPGARVDVTVRRGVPYPCPHPTDIVQISVLRVTCALGRRLYRTTFAKAFRGHVVRQQGFTCRYKKGSASNQSNPPNGIVDCAGRARNGRRRSARIYDPGQR